jgi:hypothetical protein
MISDKTLGKYCNFLSRYVSVSVRYYQEGSSNLHHPIKTCNETACDSTECSINKNYIGDRLKGNNFLADGPSKYKKR